MREQGQGGRCPPGAAAVRAAIFATALALGAGLCVLFADQPVALYFAQHTQGRAWFEAAAVPSLLALPGAALVLGVALLRGLPNVGRVWLVMSLATLAATAAKDELKWIFGRPWPQSWLQYGVYGFHPLNDSALYGGFPSGHTAYISAPLCVLWVMKPRWRGVYAAVMAAVMVGLVGADYHFVGDVVAGLLTGMLCAWGTMVLMADA